MMIVIIVFSMFAVALLLPVIDLLIKERKGELN